MREHKSISGKKTYEFIGACYLHTMMDGKAIDVYYDLDLKMEEMELI